MKMPLKSKREAGSRKESNKKKNDTSTVFERNAITRQKMAVAKDKRRRQKRLTKIFLKVKQDKEYTLMKTSQQELLSQWRPMMRELRTTEILKDFKLMQTAFETSFDKKNELIKTLEDQLRKNTSDYDDALDNHMYNIDKMFEFFKKRMGEVKKMYGIAKQSLLDTLKGENLRLTQKHLEGMEYILNRNKTVARMHQINLEEWNTILRVDMDQIRNLTMEQAIISTMQFNKQIEDIATDIEKRLSSYDKNMSPLRKQYFQLLKTSDDYSDVMENLITQIHILTIGLASLDNRIQAINFATQCQLSELTEKKKTLRQKYNEELRRHHILTSKSGKAVRKLAITVHALNAKMDENTNKRDRIMLMVERCRMHEKRNEKVDLFMTHLGIHDLVEEISNEDIVPPKHFISSTNEEISGETDYIINVPNFSHNLTCDCNPCTCDMLDEGTSNLNVTNVYKIINDYSMSERFWIRHNCCTLEIAALSQKRNMLANDNSDIKKTLRDYVGGINPWDHDPEKLASRALVEDKKEVGRFMKALKGEYNRRKS